MECFGIAILFANKQKCGLMADISTTVIYKASGLPPDEANVQQNGGKSGHYVN
jgi:hypothetical protein